MSNADMPVHPTQPLDRQGLPEYPMEWGLTKREYFAAMAMQGLCTHSGDYHTPENLASDAVMYADALLKELEN